MTEQRTYRIRASVLPVFQSKMLKLHRRADRIGVPSPRYEIVGTVEEHERGEVAPDVWEPTGRVYEVHLVHVFGVAPTYDGWHPVAVIDRDLENQGQPNVVHVLDSVESDPAWRTVGDICDHCAAQDGHHVKRGRKKLVVVEHENGERKIVGLTCVADFLGGTSPQQIAGWIEALFGLDDLASVFEGDEFGSGDGGEYRYDPEAFLAAVVIEIEEHGWLSRGRARDGGGDATADRAEERFSWRSTDHTEPPARPTKAHIVHATEALEWALDIPIDVSNDYLANVRAVAGKSGWRARDLGIGASIVYAYDREQDRARERKVEAETAQESKHLGAVGERIEITGTVTSSVFHSDDTHVRGGGYTIVRLITEDGARLVWFASGLAPDEDAKVTGKATVKAHSSYKGVNETKVTRFAWALVAGSMTETHAVGS